MNVLSNNIRGCGWSAKRVRLSQFIRKEGIDVCLIQEIKWWEVYEKIVKEM